MKNFLIKTFIFKTYDIYDIEHCHVKQENFIPLSIWSNKRF